MSEHDAHRALTDTARLRALPDPLEDTQRMPVDARRGRMVEAYSMHCAGAEVTPAYSVFGPHRSRP